MHRSFPLRDFEWMEEDKLTKWEEILETDGKGCVLEVDLEYPSHLHDDHNDYPLAPEKLTINGVDKLTPNLQDKKKHGSSCSISSTISFPWNEIAKDSQRNQISRRRIYETIY